MTDQTSQQAAVSDRKAAEQEYSITAFDYARNPVGSRDWTLYWDGWQAALKHAQQAVVSEQILALKHRKRELETEVSDLRNTLMARKSERDKALEEAAKVCEDTEAETYKFGGQTFDSASGSLANAANAIRALKGQQPAQADKDKP